MTQFDIEHGRTSAEVPDQNPMYPHYRPSELPCRGETEQRWKGWLMWWGLKKGMTVGIRYSRCNLREFENEDGGSFVGRDEAWFQYALGTVTDLKFTGRNRIPGRIWLRVEEPYPEDLSGEYWGAGSKRSARWKLGDRKYQLVAPTPAVREAAISRRRFDTHRMTLAEPGDGILGTGTELKPNGGRIKRNKKRARQKRRERKV